MTSAVSVPGDEHGGSGRVYDVFVSYRSASSRKAAEQVSRALFTLSKRHLKARSLSLFLDTDALVAGTLSHNITTALEHSRNLLVCLDPSTTSSVWVSREIEHWLNNGGDAARLFLVRTDASLDLSWDSAGAAFTNPEALPEPLRTVFHEEQKYFDVPASGRIDPSQLAGLYAALMRIDPADLALDEARYQRRRRATLSAFTTGLTVLLVLAVIASVLAVRSSNRSTVSARVAQGEAAAAQALLTLPYSPPDAIQEVLKASRMSDSLSVRSALIAVASSTGQLRRTVDWSILGTGHEVTGMVFSADGERVIGWGPSATPGSTRLAAWSIGSGELVVDADVPVSGLSELVEADSIGYLACSPTGPVLINRLTFALRKLSNQTVALCETRTFRGGALIESSQGEEGPGQVTYVSYVGRVTTYQNTWIERVNRESWSAALGNDRGVVLVSARGDARVALQDRGETLMANSIGRYLVQDGHGWTLVRHRTDGQRATAKHLDLPADVSSVSLYGAKLSTHRGYVWVNARGRLGWSGSTETVQLPQPLAGGPAAGKAQVAPDFDSVVVTFGGTVYRARPPENGGGWDLSVLGQFQADDSVDESITGYCDEGGVVALPRNQWLVPSQGSDVSERIVTATSDEAHLEGCTLVDPGPPLAVNGIKVSEGALDGQVLTSPIGSGGVAIVRPGSVVQILFAGGHTENTWRFFNESSILSANGERRVRSGDGSTVSEKDGSQIEVLGDTDGTIRAVSPDGLGAVVATTESGQTKVHYLREGRALPACNATTVTFLPGPEFPTSVSQAEQQVPVGFADGWRNCLTGQPYDFPKDLSIDEYQVGSTSARIVWSKGEGAATTRAVTSWRPGDNGSIETRELPSTEVTSGGPIRVALDLTASHLAMTDSTSGLVRTWAWSDAHWNAGIVLQSSLGNVATATWSSDATLIYTVGGKGGFELFDASNGRRLIVDQKGFDLSTEDPAPTVLVTESSGFSFVHLTSGRPDDDSRQTLEVAVSVDQLRDLLCVVHAAPACTR